MTEKIAPRAKDAAAEMTAARPSSVVSKLTSRMANAIEQHHRNIAALRVYGTPRHDGLKIGSRADEPVDIAETTAQPAPVTDAGKSVSRFARVAKWFGAVYAAHEARMAALRVYDRRL